MINNETDGFLSVCIPTFNRSERLMEIVLELLTFEHPDFRIVITDNCSTDNT
jgi:glycosyltransferase involved in cell wall biosynthesis